MYKKLSLLFVILAISSCNSQKKNNSIVTTNEIKKVEETPKMYSVSDEEIKKSGTKPYVIYFDTNSAKLTNKSLETLKNFILPDAIDKNAKRIVIEAHCDERGTEKYNQKLSVKRANAVRNHLVKNGISDKKIKAIGYGETKPVALGHDEESWAKNRRAVTIVIKK